MYGSQKHATQSRLLTRVQGVSRGLVVSTSAACVALTLLVCTNHPLTDITRICQTNAPPSFEASDAWHWATAAPGVNIYVALYGRPQRNEARVSAWVRRESFRNLAGINANQVEVWQFDCIRGTSRRLARAAEYAATAKRGSWVLSKAVSEWSRATTETAAGQVVRAACERSPAVAPIKAGEAEELDPKEGAMSSDGSIAMWFDLIRDEYCRPAHEINTHP